LFISSNLLELRMDFGNKKNVNKIYCEKCDSIFASREKFEKHFDTHSSSISSESCPLDTITQKFFNLFRKEN